MGISSAAHPTATDDRVTTVVITHDGRSRLERSLAHNHAPLIVVDNASNDGSSDTARRIAPDARVIELEKNAGAVAWNVGTRAARSPYVAFADDDSWWTPGSLALAADVLDAHPSIALVAARVLVGENSTPDPFCELLARSPLPRLPSQPGTTVLGFMARAVVVRRDALLAVGGFDALIQIHGEEERVALDLADAGHRLCYLDDVVVRHLPAPGRATGRRRRRLARNDVLTAVMRLPTRTVVLRAVRHIREGRAGSLGVADALLRLPGALAVRRRVGHDVEVQSRIVDLADGQHSWDPRPDSDRPPDPPVRARRPRTMEGPVMSMTTCSVCGNDDGDAFTITTADGRTSIFDSFECAIHAVAPVCAHCGCRVVGHRQQIGEQVFCCAHCARESTGVDLANQA
ncbi:glycosyltransferase [Mumia zhuanghuii]|uniref:Glycosyltransferase family 2 protein n=2 Tax=Mumia TaxID=1546255 RepID=A0ABW1QFY7_9ACTN|nr:MULTISPECIES: glycosyltransferase [Mumia]KAA1422936.1 glycosyltransferase [Mumia zhuanghuii]